MTSNAELVQITGLTKRFGGVLALDGVSFSLAEGEVHAVVGENGAGKSTLMKILAGVYLPDAGHIIFSGQEVRFANPLEAQRHGVSVVFQELNLFPDLTLAGNIFINREPQRHGVMDQRYMAARSRELLSSMGVSIDPRTRVRDLSTGERQMVELARALSQNARLLILDEPNSALTDRETQALFQILRRLRSQGITVIYVSHRLEEVFLIADRITVLRDGHFIDTQPVAQTSIAQVISKMIGRRLTDVFPHRESPGTDQPPVLEVKAIAKAGQLEPLDFDVRAGEIVGFAGLEGCGIEAMFSILFGLTNKDRGEITYLGQPRSLRNPWEAIDLHWGLIPASRREQGLIVDWPVIDNMTLAILNRIRTALGLVSSRQAGQTVSAFTKRLNIVSDGPFQRVINLSGGNQQKVVLAKWLATEPQLLLLDDPTRGIDVGTKADIYALIAKLAQEGMAIVLTSSELDEILGLSDRIIVLHKGRKVYECRREESEKAQVLSYINGSESSRKTSTAGRELQGSAA